MIKDNEKTSRNIEQAYNNKKYIVTGKKVYQPHYSVNAGYYATKVHTSNETLTKTGRFCHLTGNEVNKVLGFDLLYNMQ